MKYKQKKIDTLLLDNSFENLTISQFKEQTEKFYKENLTGKIIVNKHLKLPIKLVNTGLKKTIRGSNFYRYKAIALMHIDILIEFAEYSNFGLRKETDPEAVRGYFNFKSKVYIEGKLKHIRICVRWNVDGNMYYDLSVNKY
jgi:hypothetical protein